MLVLNAYYLRAAERASIEVLLTNLIPIKDVLIWTPLSSSSTLAQGSLFLSGRVTESGAWIKQAKEPSTIPAAERERRIPKSGGSISYR